MGANFLLFPDYSIFEMAFLAKESGEINNSCLKLFKRAWMHSIDFREKVIIISPILNQQLVDNHYKLERKKKQALFSVVIHYNLQEVSQIKLAQILSIEEDKEVYYVTDNEEMRILLSKEDGINPISSKEAIKLFDNVESR
tara:strand:+ start:110 stop:532 length:423 start_codon:yes stop_codon:yes gene_type:complete